MADIVDLLCRTELEEFFSTHNAEKEKRKGEGNWVPLPPNKIEKRRGNLVPPPKKKIKKKKIKKKIDVSVAAADAQFTKEKIPLRIEL